MTGNALTRAIRLSVLALALVGTSPAMAESCAALRAEFGAALISVHCGGAPSAAIYVQYSDDLGAQFGPPLRVTPEPEDAEYNGENRPKILVSDADTRRAPYLFLSWTEKTSRNFTGEIRFSRSTDGGRTFEAPRTINDDGLFTGHRFDSLFLTESGRLYLTWIDKRDVEAHAERGQPYPGAAIYYATSQDLGVSFSPNIRVAHNSCECCRIAMAPQGPDEVAILWRQIFDGHIRDHAITVLGPSGPVREIQRATVDDWYLDACPHHGPTLIAAARPGQYHMSWFSAGRRHSGIHYGRYDLATGEASDIIEVDGRPGAGHPYLMAFDGTVYLVWKGFDGAATEIRIMASRDDGRTWSMPRTLFATVEASDHPLLVGSAQGVFLSWWSQEFGYVFVDVSHGA
jgi:hypothetical protein